MADVHTRRPAEGVRCLAILTVALVLAIAASCSPGDDASGAGSMPSPETSAATSAELVAPTEQAQPSSTPAPAGPLVGLAGWSEPVALPQQRTSSSVRDVVVHDDQLIAVGSASSGDVSYGAVWRSTDAVSWQAVETTGLDVGGQWMSDVVSHHGRLVAVGGWRSGDSDRNAIGWTSADGETWEPIDVLPATAQTEHALGLAIVGDDVWIVGFYFDDELAQYRYTQDGTVVYGPDADEPPEEIGRIDLGYWSGHAPHPYAYRSTDGVRWDPVDLAGVGLAEITAVGVAPDRSPMIAGHDVEDRVAVWVQEDNGTWSTNGVRAPTGGTWPRVLTTWADHIVVAMTDGSGAVLGPDGTWTTLPADSFASSVQLDDRLVVSGWTPEDATGQRYAVIAESPNGRDWAGIQLAVDTFPSGLVMFDDRLIAAGSVATDEGRAPAVWIGGSRTEETSGTPMQPVAAPAIEALPDEPHTDLLRFDGSQWSAVLVNDDLGGATLIGEIEDLDLDTATDLAVTPDGAVWVATTKQGIHRFQDTQWTRFGLADGLPGLAVHELAVGPGETLLAVTSGGLVVFDGTRFGPPGLPLDITDARVIDLEADNRGAWVATGSGLLQWDGSTWLVHGAADGLPTPEVFGGQMPDGLATRLILSDDGVLALFPGVGWASWDGTTWTVMNPPPSDGEIVLRDGSMALRYPLDDLPWDRYDRWFPDGTVVTLLASGSISSAHLADDGAVWLVGSLEGIHRIVDGVDTHWESVAGGRLQYSSPMYVVGDHVLVEDQLGLVGYHEGAWTRYLDVDGLDYQLAGADSGFSTGPIYAVTEGPDGGLWALSRQVLPEWD
jgi:hypothetical protein